MAVGEVLQQKLLLQESLPRSIFDLPDFVSSRLSRDQQQVFQRIFWMNHSETPLCWESGACEYVAKKFKVSPTDLQFRRSLRIKNLVLGEEALLNPYRLNRPLQLSANNCDQVLGALRVKNQREDCDFCCPKEKTPEDPWPIEAGSFGMIANAAAYDGWHSMATPRLRHDPSELDEDDFLGMINLMNKWCKKVNFYDPQAKYPVAILNILPRAGSSVFHPHLQTLLAKDQPYEQVKILRDRLGFYQYVNGYPFLDDLSFCLRDLGLTFDLGSAHIIFNPAPRKEKEVIVYDNNEDGLPSADLSRAIYSIVRWWREELKVTSYNMVIYIPPVGEDIKKPGEWHNFFPFARLVERGIEGVMTCDFGAMEIYVASVIGTDPVKLARSYREFYYS